MIANTAGSAADARVGVQIWLDDKGAVRRVRIEGPLATDDPEYAVRELDLNGLD